MLTKRRGILREKPSSLFGLTALERDLLKPLPPVASPEDLEVRLSKLQELRMTIFKRMRAPTISALDRARHQAELTVISATIESTALRLRASPTLTRVKPQRQRGF